MRARELREPEWFAEPGRGQEQCGKRGTSTKTVVNGNGTIYFADLPRSGLLEQTDEPKRVGLRGFR